MEMVSIFANLIRMPFAYIRKVVCDNLVELFLAKSQICSEKSVITNKREISRNLCSFIYF